MHRPAYLDYIGAIRHDGDDPYLVMAPYLVVAAGKGTAMFSGIANAFRRRHAVTRPEIGVLRHDGDDPYLVVAPYMVVAADKGTATVFGDGKRSIDL